MNRLYSFVIGYSRAMYVEFTEDEYTVFGVFGQVVGRRTASQARPVHSDTNTSGALAVPQDVGSARLRLPAIGR